MNIDALFFLAVMFLAVALLTYGCRHAINTMTAQVTRADEATR